MLSEQLTALIPEGFSDLSKVWVFQSSRAFIEKEQKEINEQLYHFYAQWVSHGAPVKGWAKVVFNQFIVVIADDTTDRICGSATDAMMRLMKSLEKQYEVNLFDRLMITFLVKDKPEMLPFNQVGYALEKGYINESTLLFNNSAVTNKKQLFKSWLIPLKESWLGERVL
ncbi:MAG TPA: hypothetical protein VL093_02645 [Flavipsychrobacter sp.]|nr:hypothetical protein [Flavipsychrobacter sp.]